MSSLLDRTEDPWGLYVHVPWCRIRCPYCAFDVAADTPSRASDDAFVDAVLAEVDARAGALRGPRRTVYVGGGTPSRLAPGPLARLLRGLTRPETVEVTVEANPEDVSPTWLGPLVDAGLTRVSLGVQTLDPATAGRLARRASARHAASAARTLAEVGVRSWSADLMFGLPGQDAARFQADLEALLALNPPHVSVYGLTVEDGTAFARAAARGALRLPDEDAWAGMFEHLADRLGTAGLHRYEVSNFARDGHRSLHNQGYWDDLPYLGVGPSAHSDLPGDLRTVDVAGAAAWLSARDRIATREVTPPAARASDLVVSGLRGVDGVDLARLAARTGHGVASGALTPLVARGLLADDPDRLRLGPGGWPLADRVTAWVLDRLVPLGRVGPEDGRVVRSRDIR